MTFFSGMKRAVLIYINENQKEVLVSEGYKALFADPVKNNMKLYNILLLPWMIEFILVVIIIII